MSKKSKKNKMLDPSPSLKIELEDDADDIFKRAIEEEWDPYSHNDASDVGLRPKKATKGKSSNISLSIDLHGMTVTVAQQEVSEKILDMKSLYTGLVSLQVITGKGLHSGRDGGVLSREIHDYVSNKYHNNIISIDDSPCDVKLHGVPIRGHFTVVFKF